MFNLGYNINKENGAMYIIIVILQRPEDSELELIITHVKSNPEIALDRPEQSVFKLKHQSKLLNLEIFSNVCRVLLLNINILLNFLFQFYCFSFYLISIEIKVNIN